jgi:hypothetical protein
MTAVAVETVPKGATAEPVLAAETETEAETASV